MHVGGVRTELGQIQSTTQSTLSTVHHEFPDSVRIESFCRRSFDLVGEATMSEIRWTDLRKSHGYPPQSHTVGTLASAPLRPLSRSTTHQHSSRGPTTRSTNKFPTSSRLKQTCTPESPGTMFGTSGLYLHGEQGGQWTQFFNVHCVSVNPDIHIQ